MTDLIDLKERIALCNLFSPQERNLLLAAVNAHQTELRRRAIFEHREQGAKIQQIADELGISKQAVSQRLKRLEKSANWSKRFPTYFRTALRNALNKGTDVLELSEREAARLAACYSMAYYTRIPLFGRKALNMLANWLAEHGLEQPGGRGAV